MADPDIDLLVKELRAQGHTIEDVHRVADNAGEYEFVIDGEHVNLDQARRVLELDTLRANRPLP
jgi:hypothetical protein